MLTIPIGNDWNITLDGLTIAATGAVDNDATVTYALLAASSTAITSGSMASATTTGDYTAAISSTITVALTEYNNYFLTVTAVGTGGQDGYWKTKCVAKYRSDLA